MNTLTSNPNNENLVAELEAAAAKWVLEKSKYTLECLRDARRAVLKQMQPTGNETGEPRAPSGHVGGCMCSPCREWRLVQYANTQKASEQRTTAEEWENAKAVMSGEMPPCECTLRDKAPSAYHNAKCPRYVADKL